MTLNENYMLSASLSDYNKALSNVSSRYNGARCGNTGNSLSKKKGLVIYKYNYADKSFNSIDIDFLSEFIKYIVFKINSIYYVAYNVTVIRTPDGIVSELNFDISLKLESLKFATSIIENNEIENSINEELFKMIN